MRVGVLGAGQLGRMLALAGYPLGLQFRFFDVTPDAPAGHLAELVVGAYDDASALERFVRGVDVITYEFENVPLQAAKSLARHVPVWPPPEALAASQDRRTERELFEKVGLGVPRHEPVEGLEDVRRAVGRVGLPAMLKTRRMGYDGKGQSIIRHEGDIERAWRALAGRPLLLDEFIPFERELSIIAVRNRHGETAFYPLVENRHRDGILRASVAPAEAASVRHGRSGSRRRGAGSAGAETESAAHEAARRVMNALHYVGVMALEFFEHQGRLLVNEMAPRVHNTGHWTIDGAVTSQFANHLRAILDLPLGSTDAAGCCAMFNLIGTVPARAAVLAVEGAHLHLYGKSAMPGRKLGHVTVVAATPAERAARVRRLVEAGIVDEEAAAIVTSP